jgi:CHAT domain-containing protein
MAELIVWKQESADGNPPRFRFRVTCCCGPFEDLDDEVGRPDLDLGRNIAPGGPTPSEFLDAVGEWSYEKGELTQWLNEHRHRHGDELQLVVWDNSELRIPWELFWLPDNQELGLSDGHLGALLTVTRWVTMNPYKPKNVRRFEDPKPYRASGPVLAYIAETMEHDREMLRDFVVRDARSMEHLFKILRGKETLPGKPAELAMVYVACHGEFSDDAGRCVLGRYPLGRAHRLNDGLPMLRDQATLVFLNGCRTGALGVDTRRYNDGALRGFAAVFLRCGAAGVLATTGAVGMEEARALAKDLIDHLRENRDLTVADAVRQLRAKAAEAMPALLDTELSGDDLRAAEEELLPLLYPFMYVYFGSPRMLMSLAEDSGTGELAGTGG